MKMVRALIEPPQLSSSMVATLELLYDQGHHLEEYDHMLVYMDHENMEQHANTMPRLKHNGSNYASWLYWVNEEYRRFTRNPVYLYESKLHISSLHEALADEVLLAIICATVHPNVLPQSIGRDIRPEGVWRVFKAQPGVECMQKDLGISLVLAVGLSLCQFFLRKLQIG
ncbi:uncharacterized protein MELLADRAFT_105873 [Melampsora larici-populina 98AG31]|uniref:Uncharacterized protein n=1 Tax=Melampsora larici-populina (strain 98AG31 / pathotype 3-4-7) TaxID=747676 RepID=F4RJL7_MELLP|nr:uncharacterized protein MELLADRAFT_105873 [Melampsora larici-populina 98AG31]EGG07328.1 hypothetical protein MELLADRAFT_105873 [Melampsora larici-populina 98AG31]